MMKFRPFLAKNANFCHFLPDFGFGSGLPRVSPISGILSILTPIFRKGLGGNLRRGSKKGQKTDFLGSFRHFSYGKWSKNRICLQIGILPIFENRPISGFKKGRFLTHFSSIFYDFFQNNIDK